MKKCPKIPRFLTGILVGTFVTWLLAAFALHQNDVRWEFEAYQHYAGIYYCNDIGKPNPKLRFMWLDDYVKMKLDKLGKELHATPTPSKYKI